MVDLDSRGLDPYSRRMDLVNAKMVVVFMAVEGVVTECEVQVDRLKLALVQVDRLEQV